MQPDIARIRRFNRAVTVEVGALDTSFLGRGRPLGAARVLCAIGPEGRAVAEIRDELRLDSGLLSRLLRGLEGEGLIALAPDPADARRRIARLTEAGAEEVARYDALSDDRAARLLAHHPDRAALLDAMDLIASALGQHRFAIALADPAEDEARACLAAYYAELAATFPGGFDVSLSRDPEAASLRAPHGAFFLARSEGLAIGCVGLKGDGGETGEIKRLWVSPQARGLHLGSALMNEAEEAARALGMTRLRLDTNSALPRAAEMYRRMGWTEIARFNDDPYPDLFLEKTL